MKAFLAILSLCLAGCGTITARRIVEAQTPGAATGAGATLTGPANSAAPTSQTAERTILFQLPALPIPQPAIPESLIKPAPLPAAPLPPAPAWIAERVTTQLGQHQDAAGIVKFAATMSGWGTVRWVGLICILVCLGGLLWSHGNPAGYPVAFWKVGGCGLVLMFVGDHPAWLLLLLIPLGFYAAQKLGVIRIP